MGTPRPVVDPAVAREAAQRRARVARDLRWWCGRLLADTPLTDAEWSRYRRMRADQDADQIVEFYRATVAEPVPPRLAESIADHHRRAL